MGVNSRRLGLFGSMLNTGYHIGGKNIKPNQIITALFTLAYKVLHDLAPRPHLFKLFSCLLCFSHTDLSVHTDLEIANYFYALGPLHYLLPSSDMLFFLLITWRKLVNCPL